MTFNKRRQRGLAGACAAALLAGGVVRAQTTTDRAVAPAAGVPVVAGPDARVRIAHGLAMAIEGSTLQELAVQSGRAAAVPGTTGAAGNVPAGVPRVGEAGTGTLGSPAGSAGSGVSTYGRDLSPAGPGATAAGGTTTPARERQNPLPVNPEAIAPGSTEKLPGVGVTGRNGARATTSASFNAIAPSGRPGADSGAVAGRMAAALSAQPEQLMQEARLSFEASDNLLRAVDDSSPATERFRLAAERSREVAPDHGGMPAGAEAAGENRGWPDRHERFGPGDPRADQPRRQGGERLAPDQAVGAAVGR
ncbi:MAG: hypothetical protein U0835_11255 [Isosphaeraceae bacterium]